MTARAFAPGPDAAAADASASAAGRAAAVGGDIRYAPDSHRFSASQWQQANPDGDVQAAIEEAHNQGYDVID